MVVHCLKIIADDNYDAQDARQDLVTFRSNHNEVLTAQASELEAVGDEEGVPRHYRALFRFAFSESLADLRTTAESWLAANFTWWAWRYHECDHDGPPPRNCTWDSQNTSGNVPPAVIGFYIN